MLMRPRGASSVIGYRACNGAQKGSEYGAGHAMVRVCIRLRMKASRLSNHPAKLGTAKLQTTAQEHLRLEQRHRFEGLELDKDASSELNDAVTDPSQAQLGRT